MTAPLHGIVVADLTRVLSGPWCTRILADLGARVIKIEEPGFGDATRGFGKLLKKGDAQDKSTRSAYFAQPNTGKESIALSLKNEKDRLLFESILEKADVLVENFRPGVMKRLGYDWDTIHKKYPHLIMCSISGFGQTGPLAKRPAVDTIIQSMSGIVEQTGDPNDKTGIKVGPSVSDIMAGVYAANGVQAALLKRFRSGISSYVDISMLDCSLATACEPIGQFFATGIESPRMRNQNMTVAPFDIYQCAPDSEGKPTSICIAGGSKKFFQKLCEELRLEWVLKDKRFLKNASRMQYSKELRYILESALTRKPANEWCEVLNKLSIPCGPVLNVREAALQPQATSRKMIVSTEDGRFKVLGNPIKISSVPDINTRKNPPKLDGDREAILRLLQARI